MQADVIVVGAAQAGCAAAYDLARAGLSVLLLDKSADTGGKPCAGGVTEKALRLYRFDLTPVTRTVVDTLQMSLWTRRETPFTAGRRVCVMTHRPELDAYCREQAIQAGARFEVVKGIKNIRQDDQGVTLECSLGTLSARYLIGADGAHGAVRKNVFGSGFVKGAMAIEGLVAREHCQQYPQSTFDFGMAKEGYGWMFPKGDHVNVGLFIRKHGKDVIDRAALLRYVQVRLGTQEVTGIQGFPLGTWAHIHEAARGRVLLTGDAGGFCEPLLGEGIYGAVWTGQKAAAAIIHGENVAAVYEQEVARWQREIGTTHFLSKAFYKTLPISFGLLKHFGRMPLMQGYSRGLTLGQSKRLFFGAKGFAE